MLFIEKSSSLFNSNNYNWKLVTNIFKVLLFLFIVNQNFETLIYVQYKLPSEMFLLLNTFQYIILYVNMNFSVGNLLLQIFSVISCKEVLFHFSFLFSREKVHITRDLVNGGRLYYNSNRIICWRLSDSFADFFYTFCLKV